MDNEKLEIQKNIENCIESNNAFAISSKEVENLNNTIYDVSKSSTIAINDIGIAINNSLSYLLENTNLRFGDIIERLKLDFTLKFTRLEWNNKDIYVSLQIHNNYNETDKPYLYISLKDNQLVPYIPSQSDILASDWYLVNEK